MNETQTHKDAFVAFVIGNELFAVSVHKILEVLEKQHVTKIPNAPEYIMGVINFRGEIIPVIETRQKFNLPERLSTDNSVIIIFELDYGSEKTIMSAIVDSVSDVIEIQDDEIKPVPSIGSNYDISFVKGMVHKKEKFIMLLDIEKVLGEES
jgi:purine-binding chemotaxis protein CheW